MKIAIGLGASQGDRQRTLERAVVLLGRRAAWSFVACSRWYRSPPMRGGTAVGWFLNGVAVYDVALPDRDAAWDALDACRALEAAAGRRRARWWGDRPLDLDVLFTEGLTLRDPALTLPHPGLGDRPFVYWPLVEAWPDLRPQLAQLAPTPPRRHAIVPVATFARRPRIK
jgi:2-amino-4-hydroxy-6-hydroxymethyldihydropteridine diphosphokinase